MKWRQNHVAFGGRNFRFSDITKTKEISSDSSPNQYLSVFQRSTTIGHSYEIQNVYTMKNRKSQRVSYPFSTFLRVDDFSLASSVSPSSSPSPFTTSTSPFSQRFDNRNATKTKVASLTCSSSYLLSLSKNGFPSSPTSSMW